MAAGPTHMMSVRQIEMLLRERVESLARELLPNGRKDGHHWCVGDLSGTPGQSLKVQIHGAGRGMWCDYVDPKEHGGDCLDLIRLVLFNGNKVEAIKYAKSWLGLDDLSPARLATVQADTSAMAAKRQAEEEAEAEAKMKGARSLWHDKAARAIAGTPAEAYLVGRGIALDRLGAWPGSLKFHPEVWNSEHRCKIPAMLGMCVTPQGKHVATHRTYLQCCPKRGWTKIDSPNEKMVLGKIGGAFIPLRKGASGKSMAQLPAGERVTGAEGIEDVLTLAMARPDDRMVATYSLGNIGAIVFPEQIGAFLLACDRDNPTNRQLGDSVEDRKIRKKLEALENAIARQQSRGVKMLLAMPPVGVKDFNAWLQELVAAGHEDAA